MSAVVLRVGVEYDVVASASGLRVEFRSDVTGAVFDTDGDLEGVVFGNGVRLWMGGGEEFSATEVSP